MELPGRARRGYEVCAGIYRVCVGVYREVRAENITFMAGSIAYHAFVSLLPGLLVLVLAVSAVGGESLGTAVADAAQTYLTPNGNGVLEDAVDRAARNTGLSVVGGVVLLWGTLKIFRSLDQAFSDVYETEHRNPLADQFLDAAVVALALAAGFVAVAAADSVFATGDGPAAPLRGVLGGVLLVATLTVAFLPMYYVFPDADVTVREVVPGAVFAAVGWVGVESLFQVYVDVASKTETYGLLGAILLLVTWLYVSGLVVLVGAALNAVLAGRSEDVADLEWQADEQPAFADPLRELEDALAVSSVQSADDERGSVTVTVDGRTVALPAPADAEVRVTRVDRPDVLGGGSAEGELVLRWK